MAINAETHRLGPGITGPQEACDKLPPATSALASDPEMLPVCRKRFRNSILTALIFYGRAFSTVVADNQFSTLGIVLFAALARLAKATGMRYPRAKAVSVRVEPKQKAESKPAVAKAVVDRGERICRGGGDVDGDGSDLPILRKKQQSRSDDGGNEKSVKVDKEKKKVKKSSSKKKKNAIDDLFSGLF
jgi:ribonuclease MRP protein subunit RMP1